MMMPMDNTMNDAVKRATREVAAMVMLFTLTVAGLFGAILWSAAHG
ncbi:hypothetical protein H0274_06570 [Altererythrobacter sp. CC-YST694]|nr:hypothetical protein [Altererythrobacter sp. CC-YST694]MCB5424912.1 hypothetical protein [Altererythrobacter sp. CC-YST694]